MEQVVTAFLNPTKSLVKQNQSSSGSLWHSNENRSVCFTISKNYNINLTCRYLFFKEKENGRQDLASKGEWCASFQYYLPGVIYITETWCLFLWQVRDLVPESQAYMDLLAFERKLDATIMRKRLDIQEALKRPMKVHLEKVLKIKVNYYSNS